MSFRQHADPWQPRMRSQESQSHTWHVRYHYSDTISLDMISLQDLARTQHEIDRQNAEKIVRAAAAEFVDELTGLPGGIINAAQTDELTESIEILRDELKMTNGRARAVVSIGGLFFEFVDVVSREEIMRKEAEALNALKSRPARSLGRVSDIYRDVILVKKCDECGENFVRLQSVTSLSDIGDLIFSAKKKKRLCDECRADQPKFASDAQMLAEQSYVTGAASL